MGYTDTQLFINGKWQPPAEGKTLPVVNPATGNEIGRVAHAGRPDLERAVEAAQKGFEVWRDMLPAEWWRRRTGEERRHRPSADRAVRIHRVRALSPAAVHQ